MPIFEFMCVNCGTSFEHLVRSSAVQEAIRFRRETVRILERRLIAGDISELDIVRAKGELANARTELARGEALMTDLGFTGGGKGAGMVYVAGKPDHKMDNDQMIEHLSLIHISEPTRPY